MTADLTATEYGSPPEPAPDLIGGGDDASHELIMRN